MTNETTVVASEGAVEVTASWGGTTLSSALLTAEERLVVGPSGAGWLTLPAEVLAEDLTLVECVEGRWTVRAPRSAELTLSECGAARDEGAHLAITIGAGERSEVRLGEFRFQVRSTQKEAAPSRRPVGYGWMRWLGVAAVLHGVLLALFAILPPNVSALNVSSLSAETRYVSVALPAAAQETELAEAPRAPSEQTASAPEGGPGGETASPVVSESSTDAPRRAHGTFQPTPSRTATAENVTEMGILAVMAQQSWGDETSPYAAGNERIGEGGLSLAQILAMRDGPGQGPGVTGPGHGTCRGGLENCGLSTLAVGPLHTQPGADAPRVSLRDRVAPTGPTIRTLPPQVTSSGLSREQVRRTIRRHVNEVRFCYEQELQSRPDLEGRVAVQFVISQDGRVQAAQVASNTTRNAEVGSCVQQAVSRWTFPQSASPTGVTYPFLLSSR